MACWTKHNIVPTPSCQHLTSEILLLGLCYHMHSDGGTQANLCYFNILNTLARAQIYRPAAETPVGKNILVHLVHCSCHVSSKRMKHLQYRAGQNGSSNLVTTVRKRLWYVQSMCNAAPTFSKINGFATKRGYWILSSIATMEPEWIRVYCFLTEWTAPCNELIRACIWNGKKGDCSQLFKTTVTSLGKCCSEEIAEWFEENIGSKVSRKERYREKELKSWREWNYTNGFIKSPKEIRPRFQTHPGALHGLSILLDPKVDRNFCTTSEFKGFRLRSHTPVDAQQMDKYSKAIGLNREIFMAVTPTITMADPDLHSVTFERRKCLFTQEKKLKFYSVYTHKNCFLECISELLRTNCSCSAYNLVKAPKTPIYSTDRKSQENRCRVTTESGLFAHNA
ncbi:unnamed protein product [Allacma fusca]|uniref:Uncharacterized protein n=1 Tax=Allacma fusca TaxID=39272 RepID=A0A8J2K3M1_9HEXA|nr:unnamed protein product [Allacma fusca]